MALHFYSLCFYLLLPLVMLRLLWRSVKEPEYRAQPWQRLGFFRSCHAIGVKQQDAEVSLQQEAEDSSQENAEGSLQQQAEGSSQEKAEGSLQQQAEGSSQENAEGSLHQQVVGSTIWVHAVSAGETIAVAPLVEKLVARGHHCIVTNMTPTGRQMCRHLLGHLGNQVENCYAPWDLPGAVNRFIRNNKPAALLLVDTELWPNMLHCSQLAGVKTLLINGRLSAPSAAGYHRIGFLAKPMLACLDLLAVQTEQHARRFQELGVAIESIRVTGNIKFDAPTAPKGNLDARPGEHAAGTMVAGRPVIMGASTHPGEEAALLAALPSLLQIKPNLLLVLAPRHVRRADEVRQLVTQAGFASCSRTQARPLSANEQVFILDVMGEMQPWLNHAEIALVGGSLVPVGGHNLLEAVRGKAAVIMGSHLHNIEDIAAQFLSADAMRVVTSGQELQQQFKLLLEQAELRQAICTRATAVLDANRGALGRVLKVTLEVLAGVAPRAAAVAAGPGAENNSGSAG